MSETTIPLARAWNSWGSEHPAEMSFLPLGLYVSPCAYASSRNSFTRFPAGSPGVRLGPRAIDGNAVRLDLDHAGTALAFHYDKPDPFTLRGAWAVQRLGEWGLRFWILVVLRLSPPGRGGNLVEWTFDPETGEASAQFGAHQIAMRGERPPLLATFHDSLEALQVEFETKGYFCLDSRNTRGPLVAMRYHLEEMPRFSFAVTIGNERALARAALTSGLTSPVQQTADEPAQRGMFDAALDAVRDVVAWNTVWDPDNRRSYTSLSRNWVAQKFGGWGIWLDDLFYHGLMAGLFDAGVAHENLQAVLAGATPQGNLPCLLTGRDSWVDRSQPPIGAFIVWMLYLRTGNRELLTLSYETLRRNHEWWWQTRDGNGDGLVEYGTSPVGSGLYRGTKLAAKDESSMDNSPTHDEATLDTASWTLDCADVGLNSLLALDGEMLALIARRLDHGSEAARLERRADQLKDRIRTRLWDKKRQVFANRLWSGAFVRSLAPTSFYPLLAGAANAEQTDAMIKLLDDPAKFGGEWLLPSVTRDDPAFADNVYWRGRIWPPLNFLVWHALRRTGRHDEAHRLAESGYRLFMRAWTQRCCPENYDADSGEALDQPDTDSFYGWGALLPYLAVAELIDVNPWGGWEVTNPGIGASIGPVLTPSGAVTLECKKGILSLAIGGTERLRTNIVGRLTGLEISERSIRCILPRGIAAEAWIAFAGVPASAVVTATLDSKPIAVRARRNELSIALPRAAVARRLELHFAGPRPT